jgi:type VI secretion system protein ImpC
MNKMATARAAQKPIDEVVQLDAPDLLEEIVSSGIKARDETQKERGQELIRNLVDQLTDPSFVVEKGVTETIDLRIAQIDELLSRQMDEIVHHPEFQKLEASWRGLNKLVKASETGEYLKIKVLNVSRKDLLRDFQRATEFTESALWKAVYEYEFGLYGGDPFGCLIGDYEFGKGPQDVSLMQHMSQVAAASHAPFISAAASGMFGLESWTDLPNPRDLAKIFDKSNPENTKWLSLRDSEDSRFVALCLPHVLRRLPYGQETEECDSFAYEEDVSKYHEHYLWGNACYEYAERITDAFAKYHWCMAIRGPEGGGLVEDLPIHTFKTREGDIGSKVPTEVLIPDTREKELSDLGFISLVQCKNTDYAAFFGGNSVQRPKKYDLAEATGNAALSSRIPYLFTSCRIAHYLKAICRDKIGSFLERKDVEDYLNRWLMQYVLNMDDATQSQKAEKPLRAAQVQVTDDKARPGCYKAVAHLRPHFQLEEIGVALSLVTDLPPKAEQ